MYLIVCPSKYFNMSFSLYLNLWLSMHFNLSPCIFFSLSLNACLTLSKLKFHQCPSWCLSIYSNLCPNSYSNLCPRWCSLSFPVGILVFDLVCVSANLLYPKVYISICPSLIKRKFLSIFPSMRRLGWPMATLLLTSVEG